MDVDRHLLERMAFSSQEQRAALQALLSGERVKPELALVLAVFRDVVVFRDLMNAKVLQQDQKIRELEARIGELEEDKSEHPCEGWGEDR